MAFNRRRFLMGVGGAVVGLPMLEGLAPRKAHAAVTPPFVLFHRKGNGVQQALGMDPARGFARVPNYETERWWPSFDPGALTNTNLKSDTSRALSEIGDYGSRMAIIRGLRHPSSIRLLPGQVFETEAGHAEGFAQGLTGAGIRGGKLEERSLGESLDGRIARHLNSAKPDPLFMDTGRPESGKSPSYTTLADPLDPLWVIRRQGNKNLLSVFETLFLPVVGSGAAQQLLKNQRKSVNDLVREDFAALKRDSRLSKSDLERLDVHLTAIRDLEQVLACTIPADLQGTVTAYQSAFANDAFGQNGYTMDQFAELSARLAVLAIACSASQSVLINFGHPQDDTVYRFVPEVTGQDFHNWSHRLGTSAELRHHQIDRYHLKQFKKVLDGLDAYTFGDGTTLLDAGMCMHYSDLATGSHICSNTLSQLPYLYVGGMGGALKTGLYLRVNGEPLVKLLNTVGAAIGVKNEAGGPLDDFNASNNGGFKGRLDALIG